MKTAADFACASDSSKYPLVRSESFLIWKASTLYQLETAAIASFPYTFILSFYNYVFLFEKKV